MKLKQTMWEYGTYEWSTVAELINVIREYNLGINDIVSDDYATNKEVD